MTNILASFPGLCHHLVVEHLHTVSYQKLEPGKDWKVGMRLQLQVFVQPTPQGWWNWFGFGRTTLELLPPPLPPPVTSKDVSSWGMVYRLQTALTMAMILLQMSSDGLSGCFAITMSLLRSKTEQQATEW